MTYPARLGLIAAVATLGCFGLAKSAYAIPVAVGAQIFDDEMNGTSVDSSKWSVYEPGVWHDAINTSDAVTEGNGAMKISTYTTGGQNYNAVMSTAGKFSAKSGYFEARIQFNGAPGVWSSFWMNSPNIGTPIGDPADAGVETDIVEHRAVDQSNQSVVNKYNTALHWDGYGANAQYSEQLNGPIVGLGNGSWHTYGLLWTPTSYTMYFDDVAQWTQTAPISQTPEYMLLSSECESGNWAGTVPSGGYGSAASSTTNPLVDYVHVYNLATTATPEPASITLLSAPIVLMMKRRRA